MKNKSENINELLSALTKFQGMEPRIENTKKAHKYKYAPLEIVINTIRPMLGEHGLGFQQYVILSDDEKKVYISTIIFHESGQYIEYEPIAIPIDYDQKSVNASQAVGVAITYARRYALSAILGINSEDDTDGKAPGDNGKPGKKPNKKPKNKQPKTPLDKLRNYYKADPKVRARLDEVIEQEGNLQQLPLARQMSLLEKIEKNNSK